MVFMVFIIYDNINKNLLARRVSKRIIEKFFWTFSFYGKKFARQIFGFIFRNRFLKTKAFFKGVVIFNNYDIWEK